jgi:hypothetical protein
VVNASLKPAVTAQRKAPTTIGRRAHEEEGPEETSRDTFGSHLLEYVARAQTLGG